MKNLFWSVLFLCAFFILGSGSARAQSVYAPGQYSVPVFQKMYDRQFMTNIAVNGLMRSQMTRDAAKGVKPGNKRQSAPIRNPLEFKPSGVALITDAELAAMTKSADEKKQLEAFFNDCLSGYIEVARRDGFNPTDVAYAFNYFVTNNYHVYKDVLHNYRGYQNRGVLILSTLPDYINSNGEKKIYENFSGLLKADAGFMKMSDAEKEKLTAYLALMTTLAWRFYDSATKTGDIQKIEKARSMAKANLESLFSVPADKISISSEGFISLP